ncbi:MAG: arsenic resistance N-acetyltransferase ArsN2 [Desulfobacterales bacterium]|nr:arsenic resistance N-acetyltransferase ArsN2 [Desulfobacterales bacterium]
MDLENILSVTVSGMRPGEEDAVKKVLDVSGLHTSDLTPEKLRHFIVARKGEDIVGVVGVELFQPHALLRSLAVVTTHRGQGIGAQLIVSVERYARMMGATTLYLLTTTAAPFFNHREFRETSRADAPAPLQSTEEFKALCPATAVCMCKQIDRRAPKDRGQRR